MVFPSSALTLTLLEAGLGILKELLLSKLKTLTTLQHNLNTVVGLNIKMTVQTPPILFHPTQTQR